MKKLKWLILTLPVFTLCAQAANYESPDLRRGEEVYKASCATSYCHGVGGMTAGAPRLAARDFDVAYIAQVISNGVPDTTMAGFVNTLESNDLLAVMTYVASLNGIMNPDFSPTDPLASLGISVPNPKQKILSGTPLEGRELFFDAYEKGIKRCSTCHEIEGMGIPVAAPIQNVPTSINDLRKLITPQVVEISVLNDTMPALILKRTAEGIQFYDLTVAPPVLRTISELTNVTFKEGKSWQHVNVMQAYSENELEKLLIYLQSVVE